MKRILLFLSLTLSLPCFAWTTKDVFAKYPNPCFIETGSYVGDGIQAARDARFQEIHSIELSFKYYAHCTQRFSEYPNIHIWQGDSAKVLSNVLKTINTPVTFWLDGHCSFGDTAKGDTMTPILQELESIKKHPIKTHTILIDDVRLFGTKEFDFLPLGRVIEKIYEINPHYTITFENGYVQDDVLVAFIP